MNGVAVTLQPSEEAEGEDADKEANQRQQDPHPRDDIQEHVVHAVCFLCEEEAGNKVRNAPLVGHFKNTLVRSWDYCLTLIC